MKTIALKCGCATHLRGEPGDSGKARFCERKSGHTGRHMAYYCGKRRYWKLSDKTP